MAEQICPVCGCTVVGGGYKEKGKAYCCEPCASGSSSRCRCGCCSVVDEPKKK